MNTCKGCVLLILSVLSFWSVLAQSKNIVRGDQQWVQYYLQYELSPKWSVLADGGYRWADAFRVPSQYVIRAGVGYQVNPNVNLVMGLAHVGIYSENEITRREYRPYQEYKINQDLGKLGLQHRFRSEQRIFRDVSNNGTTSGDSFNFRFRYYIQFTIPLVKSFPNHPGLSLSMNVGDEIFINAGRDIVHNIFDQNRLLVGPVIQFNPHLAITLTYNNLFGSRNAPSEFVHNQIIWIGIKHKLIRDKRSRS